MRVVNCSNPNDIANVSDESYDDPSTPGQKNQLIPIKYKSIDHN